MRNFNMNRVEKLVKKSLKEIPTGDTWLDSRYNEQIHYVAHTQPYYRAFYYIAEALKPEFTVELGAWQATAASHFAVGNPAGKVVTIDIHKDGDDKAVERTLEAVEHLAPRLTYINKWTWDAVDDVKAFGLPIDILYIDSWHEYKYIARDWKDYEPLLADIALVIIDDCMHAPPTNLHIDKFFNELEGEKFIDAEAHLGIPMGYLKYVREKDESVSEVAASATTGKLVKTPARTRARKSAKRTQWGKA